MNRRFLSVVLSLSLAAGGAAACPALAAAPETAPDLEQRFREAEALWPDGAPYEDRLDDGCTLCFGFVRELYGFLFDAELPTMWEPETATFGNKPELAELVYHAEGYSLEDVKELLSLAQPGDVLIAANNRTNHGVIVRDVAEDGSGVRVYDANWEKGPRGEPLLRTDGFWSAEDIQRNRPKAISLYRRPAAPVTEPSEDPDEEAPADAALTSGEGDLPRFTDVAEGAWYAPSVRAAADLGLMQGDEGGAFRPDDTLTLLQTVVLAARSRNLYLGGDADFTPEENAPWYQPYLVYALEQGLLDGIGGEVNREVTRREMALLFDRAVPAEALAPVLDVPDGAIPDLDPEDPAAPAVYRLYRAGVLTGGEEGAFSPDAVLTRAEAATLIARVMDPSLRVVPLAEEAPAEEAGTDAEAEPAVENELEIEVEAE